MSTITDYTDYASIRAVLGLSSKELTDTVLGSTLYLYGLKAELAAIDADLPADVIVARVAGEAVAGVTDLLEAVSLFSAYTVALMCYDSFMNLAPKSITDGKAALTRHSDKAPQMTKDSLNSRMLQYKELVRNAYLVYGGGSAAAAAQPTLMVVSVSDYDTVLGE